MMILGGDGSSNHPIYRFKRLRKTGRSGTDHNMFCSELTVLRLVATLNDGSKEVLYESPAPNSFYGIAPLRYAFEKETTG